MRSENFNEEAMEQKIKVNKEKGFDIPGIKVALKEEMIRIFQQIRLLESRNVELSDQIDYMDEKYPNG